MPNVLEIYTQPDPLYPLLKTGQTTSYETGDDGDLEKGIAKDYTTLTTGRYSGTTNITINSKTHALSNNCVKDNKTGLFWARYVPLADIGPNNDGHLFWLDAVNGEHIWAFLAQANANSLAGYNDWRIPNYFELASILDLGTYNPCIDTTVFPSTPSTSHLTSTTYTSTSASAFRIHFRYGYVYNAAKTTIPYPVRLVRG